MNKKAVYLATLAFAGILASVIFFTRPSVESAWFLIIFFVIYYSTAYFVVLSGCVFLEQAVHRSRRIALVAASVVTAMQILITFNALRPLELALITAALVVTGWYVSRAKT